MRHAPNLRAERFRVAGPPRSNCGAFTVPAPTGAVLRVMAGDGFGWDHVSVSLPHRDPTWEEMCHVKDLFFRDDECVMELHPPKADYVNHHPHCLHLWRPQTAGEIEALRAEWEAAGEAFPPAAPPGPIPQPPHGLVGPRPGEDFAQLAEGLLP